MSKLTTKGRKKYRFQATIRFAERDAAGNHKKRECTVDGWSETQALITLLNKHKAAGFHNIRSAVLQSDPIPVKDFKLPKPPLHKDKAYLRKYDGTKLIGYEHRETGIVLTPQEYKDLD